MKQIELSQDRVALVDDEDFEWLSRWKWTYWRDKKTGYAKRHIGQGAGQQRQTIQMHVAILKRHKLWKRGGEVDHINMCGCDNRKENLRFATLNQNRANTGLRSNNTSGVSGVNWDKQTSKWRAFIRINGRQKCLGYFVNKKDAAAVRQQAEIKYFGEFQHDPINVCPLGYTGECPGCAIRLRERHDTAEAVS